MSMMYGFIVAAWLVMPATDNIRPIPFATIEKCEQAVQKIMMEQKAKRFFSDLTGSKPSCLATGIKNDP